MMAAGCSYGTETANTKFTYTDMNGDNIASKANNKISFALWFNVAITKPYHTIFLLRRAPYT